jgi:hypothetical protein
MRIILAILLGISLQVEAQGFSRAGWSEFSLYPLSLVRTDYDFARTTAHVDTGMGIGFSYAYHLNERFALSVDSSFAVADYHGRVQPGAGNPGPAFDTADTLERGTLRLHGTWHLVPGPFTPLLNAGFGWTYIDPGKKTVPPAAGCWIYPWWGEFCAARPPTHGFTRFTTIAGAGLRWDLAGDRGFIRMMASGEWIDWSGPPGTLRNVELRADFGARF